MSFFRRRRIVLPPPDPCWVSDRFIVIGLPDHMQAFVTYKGEDLPRGLQHPLPGDRQILTFLGCTLQRRKRGEDLLDTSKEGVQKTTVTRDHTQLWLPVHPQQDPMMVVFDLSSCWEQATGRPLEPQDGPPPHAEGVPQ